MTPSRHLLVLATACAVLLFAPAAQAAAPQVLKSGVTAVTGTSATVTGEVVLGEKPTTYRFQYGPADCSVSACTSTPTGELLVKDGSPRQVQAKVDGLPEGTTFHFRLLAHNSNGDAQSADRTFTTRVAQGPFGPCPNDALRLHNPMASAIESSSANLPDCRAYEQASPSDKNGSDAIGLVGSVIASPEGDAISFNTTASIPGGEGAQEEIPAWLASKADEQWSTQGLYASAAAGDTMRIKGWLPDFSQTFQFARKEGPPREAAFLARSSVDRSLTQITPYHTFSGDPEYSYVGASADGRTVIFEANEALAPEAIAGRSNVYAWDPATDTVRLVSLLPEDECESAPCSPPAGAFGGAYAWIKQVQPALEGQKATAEGGALFGEYSQSLNVVSGDGRYAYFTAAKTGQLYVRVNPTAAQSPLDSEGDCTDPGLACTIHVSASQKTKGKGDGGRDAAGTRPAAFMAASKDGSQVFFTSPEKLTDDANTGPEPEDLPTVYRAKANGEAASLQPGFIQSRAFGMVSDGEHLYWADPIRGSIGRAKLNGEGAATEEEDEFVTREELEAEVEVEVETAPDEFEPQIQSFAVPRYVAVGGGYLYWTNATDGEDGHGVIGRAKLGLSGPEDPEPDFITGASNPTGIDVDETSTFLYWGNAGTFGSTQTIGRAILGGSGAEEVNQGFIRVSLPPAVTEGIAVDATHIYAAVSENANSYLFRYDIDGDPDSWKVSGDENHPNAPGIHGLALDSTYVYWTRPWDESVGRVPIADLGTSEPCSLIPTCEPEFIKGVGRPYGLALDAGHLYWSANQEVLPNLGNDLYRFDAESGLLEDLTPDSAEKNGAEVKGVLGTSADGSSVYFAANGVLAAGAEPGDCKASEAGGNFPTMGECNLYLSRQGHPLVYLGPIGEALNWISTRLRTPRVRKTSRVSPDGQTLLFSSARQLTAYENEGVKVLYRYRVGEGIECVSCNPTGELSSGAGLASLAPPFLYLPLAVAAVLTRNLSADGNRVFFETAEALVAADTNGEGGCPEIGTDRFVTPACLDVYEWEAPGTGSCTEAPSTGYVPQNGGCLYLLSSGTSDRPSYFADASEDGDEAFIVTRTRLVGQDKDDLYDLYDASGDGGLPSQSLPSPVPCEGEACKGPVQPAPQGPTPATGPFLGPGNAKPPRKCPKGKRKVTTKGKTRCVPRKHKKKGGKSHHQHNQKGRTAR